MKVYLDNAATTKIDDTVLEELNFCLKEIYGNPSSVHSMGQAAAAKVENAREICAEAIHCRPDEIIFTGGGTEADNMAIIGYAKANGQKGRHIITTSIEHHAVLNSCRQLEKEGFDVTYLPVNAEGIIDVGMVVDAIRDDTILISIMYANNEIGTIQPIKEIGEIAGGKKIAFHSDAVQSFGKTEIDIKQLNLDMMSVSAHKLHGPKGVGFLYLRNGIKMNPVILGGSQERNFRAGTINAPLISALAATVQISLNGMEERENEIRSLRDYFINRILNEIDDVILNGSLECRISENANFSFKGIKSDALLYAMDLQGVCISAGSACTAGSIETSHVIKAIGREGCGASARFTLSKYTTKDELDYTIGVLKKVVENCRK